ncbi:MAG: hypothetical protein JSS23_11230 [Proteobacteria bacterium]|nr:hypothetical protein [Pseudomonadota bacterium]
MIFRAVLTLEVPDSIAARLLDHEHTRKLLDTPFEQLHPVQKQLVLLAIATGGLQQGVLAHIPRKLEDCAERANGQMSLTTPKSAIQVWAKLEDVAPTAPEAQPVEDGPA